MKSQLHSITCKRSVSSGRGDEANNDDLQCDTHSVDANCENLLDRVYNAVRNGQSPYELQRDGWQIGTIHEAVGIWYDLEAFVKSQEKGLSMALGFEELDWQQRTF